MPLFSQQDIEAALDSVCDILPAAIKTECLPFVNEYAPFVVKLLVQKLDPKDVCTFLGICTNSSQTVKVEEIEGMNFQGKFILTSLCSLKFIC